MDVRRRPRQCPGRHRHLHRAGPQARIPRPDQEPDQENFVYEVRSPGPCTIVHAANEVAVVLPLPGHITVPQQLDGATINMATYRWPDMYGPYTKPWKPTDPPIIGHHNLVGDAMGKGYLFHGDMCLDHAWADPTR
jgi:hypothetical protein